mgnify:CR=1 FL=1
MHSHGGGGGEKRSSGTMLETHHRKTKTDGLNPKFLSRSETKFKKEADFISRETRLKDFVRIKRER